MPAQYTGILAMSGAHDHVRAVREKFFSCASVSVGEGGGVILSVCVPGL